MNNDDLLKKDWQLLTARTGMTSLSYLQTIMENQAVIISKLQDIPIKDVLEQMNKYRNENYLSVVKNIKENIPDYSSLTERKY